PSSPSPSFSLPLSSLFLLPSPFPSSSLSSLFLSSPSSLPLFFLLPLLFLFSFSSPPFPLSPLPLFPSPLLPLPFSFF
ncbi:hypothetical protein ACXWRW_11830, partial [Streptococcus pyogenes]